VEGGPVLAAWGGHLVVGWVGEGEFEERIRGGDACGGGGTDEGSTRKFMRRTGLEHPLRKADSRNGPM